MVLHMVTRYRNKQSRRLEGVRVSRPACPALCMSRFFSCHDNASSQSGVREGQREALVSALNYQRRPEHIWQRATAACWHCVAARECLTAV